MSEFTQLLESLAAGGEDPTARLFSLVYDELRRIAAHQMVKEQPGQTLQPTALVHEAWLRLAGDASGNYQNRAHFFATAAEAMRRILIENARRKHALKRGAGAVRLDLDDVNVAASADDETLLAVNDALKKLEIDDAESARVVKLRFFAGLTNDETAQALGISERTVKRHWTFARARLYQELRFPK